LESAQNEAKQGNAHGIFVAGKKKAREEVACTVLKFVNPDNFRNPREIL